MVTNFNSGHCSKRAGGWDGGMGGGSTNRCLEHEEPPKQGCTQVDQSDVVVV